MVPDDDSHGATAGEYFLIMNPSSCASETPHGLPLQLCMWEVGAGAITAPLRQDDSCWSGQFT
jgi:hypothetical protein